MSVILNAGEINRALRRISHEILEKNHGSADVVLLGIPTRGAHLSLRIAQEIESIEKNSVRHGILDITMYRDDLAKNPTRAVTATELPGGGVDGKVVVLDAKGEVKLLATDPKRRWIDAVALHARTFPPVPGRGVGSGFFPILIGVGLALGLGVGAATRPVRPRASTRRSTSSPWQRAPRSCKSPSTLPSACARR